MWGLFARRIYADVLAELRHDLGREIAKARERVDCLLDLRERKFRRLAQSVDVGFEFTCGREAQFGAHIGRSVL